MPNFLKKIIWILIPVGILAFIVNQFLIKPTKVETKDTKIETAVVKTRDLVEHLKLIGEVVAQRDVAVFPDTSGQVTKVLVHEGELVKEGDPMLELDQSHLANEINTEELNMKKQAITLKNALEEFKRKKTLYDEQFIAELEYIEAEKSYSIAKVDYELSEKKLKSLQEQLGKTKLLAPITGVISRIDIAEGESLEGGMRESTTKSPITISDEREKSIELMVSDVERQSIVVDQEVQCWAESDPSKKFPGVVLNVGAAAKTERGFSQFRIEVDILEGDADLTLGVQAAVQLTVDESKGALTVPITAIFSDGIEKYVYVQDGEKFNKQTVTTGISSRDSIEIVHGVSAGQTVALDDPTME